MLFGSLFSELHHSHDHGRVQHDRRAYPPRLPPDHSCALAAHAAVCVPAVMSRGHDFKPPVVPRRLFKSVFDWGFQSDGSGEKYLSSEGIYLCRGKVGLPWHSSTNMVLRRTSAVFLGHITACSGDAMHCTAEPQHRKGRRALEAVGREQRSAWHCTVGLICMLTKSLFRLLLPSAYSEVSSPRVCYRVERRF